MKRRSFIKNTAAATLLPALLNKFSFSAYGANPLLQSLVNTATETDKVLVLIFLSGGNDGLNTVIPLNLYSQLSSARSNVLIPQNQVLPLNGRTDVGLHPAMTGMQALFNEGKLQIIQDVGYPTPNFSHFRSTDIWTSASDSNQYLTSGWVGRYLDKEYPGFPTGYPNGSMPDPLAIQIGANLPLMFQGPSANMAMTVSGPAIFGQWATGITDPAPNTPAGKELNYIRLIADQTEQYAQSIINAFGKVPQQSSGWPTAGTNYLADVLKVISALVVGGLKTRLYLVGLYGFDTHASQVADGSPATGTHADLLGKLSQAVTAFQDDCEFLGTADRVLGMTFSEFGRRIASNASSGTDHGAAGPIFVFGNKVQGGILGNTPTLPGTITAEDNLPMQYDFRSVYSSILKDWFCVDSTELDAVMLQQFQQLPIVNNICSTGTIGEIINQQSLISVSNYPNPFSSSTYIRFTTTGGHAQVQVFDALGRLVKTVANGQYPAGTHEVWFENEGLKAGNYYCRLQNGPLQEVSVMQILQ